MGRKNEYVIEERGEPGGFKPFITHNKAEAKAEAQRRANQFGECVIVWVYYEGGGCEPFSSAHPEEKGA